MVDSTGSTGSTTSGLLSLQPDRNSDRARKKEPFFKVCFLKTELAGN